MQQKLLKQTTFRGSKWIIVHLERKFASSNKNKINGKETLKELELTMKLQ
jgi:hypothetical protein